MTNIEWTDETWNPTRGCSRVSPGCVNCYAERVAVRFEWRNVAGEGGEKVAPGPFHGFITTKNGHPAWTGKVELIESKILEPLRWKKPRRIFVNSMSDLFHEAIPANDIAEVFRVMQRADWHTYQILTKRADRLAEIMPRIVATFGLMPHVWLGVSVENQQYADERIPLLLQTPAAVRFVSYEPALGPVDFSKWLCGCGVPGGAFEGMCNGQHGLDWVIVGGESGPGARAFDIAWARNTIEQCRRAGVACFVKQLGAFPCEEREYGTAKGSSPVPMKLKDRKGGDPSEWPDDLRVRQFPQTTTDGPQSTPEATK